MTKRTLTFALALIILGLVSYFATGAVSKTALIPSYLGAVVFLCALIAIKESLTKHVMHVAILLTLVGFFGSVSGLFQVFKMLAGETLARPEASIAKAAMALLCLGYIILCVRWFISNRKKKREEAALSS